MQIIAHANGDASINQLIEAIKLSRGVNYAPAKTDKYPFNFTNLDSERIVCIHCQVTKPQQIIQLRDNYIIPSFFGSHIFFWGDWHYDHTIGQRANSLSRAGSAVKQAMLFTSHLDTPVLRPNLFYAIASAVNRKTRKGMVLGADEKITPYQALLSITRFVAYQMFE